MNLRQISSTDTVQKVVNDYNLNMQDIQANASLLQSGSFTLQLTSGVGSGTVTFPEPYPSIPPYVVMAPVIGGSLGNKLNFGVQNITKEGFGVICKRDTGYTSVIFHWISVPR